MPLIAEIGVSVDSTRARAAAHLRQHIRVGTELAVREELQLHLAVGILPDALSRFLHRHDHRMVCRIVVAEFEHVFGLLCSRGTNGGRCERCGGGALQESPAIRRTHGHSPLEAVME